MLQSPCHVVSQIKKLNRMKGAPLRVLFICPQFPPSYWSFHYVGRFAGKTATMPPLGLLTIAALCPTEWDIRVIDEGVEELRGDDIAWADLVCVTAMIIQYDRAVYVARKARSLGKPVLIGGPHVNGEPEAYVDEFDVLVQNEGEITFRQFVQDYLAGQVKARYATSEKADMATTPVARYDLLRHRKRYMNFSIQFSRGCPHGCEFCDVTRALGRHLRTKPAAIFLKELEGILSTGYRGPVFVADDNFTANRRKAIELCKEISDWNRKNGYPFTYYTQASVDLARQPEMLSAMAEARFNGVFLGFETPSDESLQGSGKTQNVQIDMAEVVKKIQEYGIRVDGGFIVGFDHDKPDIFQRQVDFIERINVSAAMVGILTAPYATEMFDRLKAENRLLVDKTPLTQNLQLESYNVGGLMNVVPKNFSSSELMRGYAYVLSSIYNPSNYFQRVVRQIAALEPGPSDPLMTLRNILIRFPLLTLLVVVMFPCRVQYLRAAFRVLFRYPNRLRDFSMLVLRGIHYIEVTRREVVPWAEKEAVRLEKEEHKEADASISA